MDCLNHRITEAAFHITNCCSHHCPFCYAIDDSVKHFHQDPIVLKKIVERLNQIGCKSVLFVGGDPASHPNVIEIAKFAKNLNMETAILSNTLSFNNCSPKQVVTAFDTIEATIHSPIPEKHDLFCGASGAYNNVINNLKLFSDEKVYLGIVVNITPDTLSQLFKIVRRVFEIDKTPINHVLFQRIIPIGRANNRTDWQLSLDSIAEIFEQVALIKEYGIECSFEDTLPLCVLPVEYKKYFSKCDWGTNKISLDMFGNYSKCCADPRYIVGNILDDSFFDNWNNSPELLKRRSGLLVPQKCRECTDYESCGGGCILASELNGCSGDPLIH